MVTYISNLTSIIKKSYSFFIAVIEEIPTGLQSLYTHLLFVL